ncbi:hypothetical protein FOA43_000652 [Brettanomyces nanus]|uniref:GOLD domain-containing protein n=1 Tax=Eeniella nana TaxID=13502 RepID=A0A875RZM5_EENNA|nr:uncharacterized protein FOA43_000652 [Brettanomyces nanus]QPG73342.1 hypothetical protein FOA43_000652 [Brettanomyces nanus]
MLGVQLVAMLVLLLLPCYAAVEVGKIIQVSGSNAVQINSLVSQRRHELNSLKDKIKGSSKGFFRSSGISSSQRKELDNAFENLQSAVNDYLICNTCLRYHLNDYVDFDEVDQSPGGYKGVMVAINIRFQGEPDHKIQMLNLNVMDRDMNTLRKISGIHEQAVHMAIDYSVLTKDRTSYSKEYIDICFENLKVDRSWNSKPREIDADMSIEFGMPSIASIYKKSSEKIGKIQKKLLRADTELEAIVKQTLFTRANADNALRDINEDTYAKQTILCTATIVVYIIASLCQTLWLKRYLRVHNYL